MKAGRPSPPCRIAALPHPRSCPYMYACPRLCILISGGRLRRSNLDLGLDLDRVCP